MGKNTTLLFEISWIHRFGIWVWGLFCFDALTVHSLWQNWKKSQRLNNIVVRTCVILHKIILLGNNISLPDARFVLSFHLFLLNPVRIKAERSLSSEDFSVPALPRLIREESSKFLDVRQSWFLARSCH